MFRIHYLVDFKRKVYITKNDISIMSKSEARLLKFPLPSLYNSFKNLDEMVTTIADALGTYFTVRAPDTITKHISPSIYGLFDSVIEAYALALNSSSNGNLDFYVIKPQHSIILQKAMSGKQSFSESYLELKEKFNSFDKPLNEFNKDKSLFRGFQELHYLMRFKPNFRGKHAQLFDGLIFNFITEGPLVGSGADTIFHYTPFTKQDDFRAEYISLKLSDYSSRHSA